MTTGPDAALPKSILQTEEGSRLQSCGDDPAWRRWGPYLSERQWGTVREDYSAGGTAWDYLPHDHARSRAYRWGEDGIAGFGDDELNWCLGLALWNGRDPILKERLFGLTNAEGNHGEDVKELYYYLDGVPTHAYMKMLYKYPQAAFPYDRLVAENRRRGVHDREFEIVDTGVFDQGRYFDVFVEYAKASPDDILMQITVHNRAPEAASLHMLPQLWARNRWSWRDGAPRPRLSAQADGTVRAEHPDMAADGARDRAAARDAVLRERDQCAPPVRRRGHRFLQGRHQRFRRAWRARRDQSGGRRHQVRRPHRAHRRRGRGGDDPGAVAPRRRDARPRSPISPPCSRPGGGRPMPSTRPSSRAWPIPTSAWCSGRRWPGCCGRSSSIATTCAAGCSAIRRSHSRRPSAGTAATASGRI